MKSSSNWNSSYSKYVEQMFWGVVETCRFETSPDFTKNSPKHKSPPLSNPKSTTLQIASLINNGQVDHTRSRRRCRRWVHRPCHDLASLGEQDTPSGNNGLNCCSSGISWQRELSPTNKIIDDSQVNCAIALKAITNINTSTKPKIGYRYKPSFYSNITLQRSGIWNLAQTPRKIYSNTTKNPENFDCSLCLTGEFFPNLCCQTFNSTSK